MLIPSHGSGTLDLSGPPRSAADETPEVTMMGWYGGGMGVGAWIMMGLFWVLLIGAIVWLAVQLA
ncbi:MAG TPA: hypothetical protein VGK17_07155, partial [Propionicimonas sp.]